MPHPLVSNLTELSTEELYAKFSDLNKKLNTAYRIGMGDAIQQLQMIREDYQAEITRRDQKALAELLEKNPNFKDSIDIS